MRSVGLVCLQSLTLAQNKACVGKAEAYRLALLDDGVTDEEIVAPLSTCGKQQLSNLLMDKIGDDAQRH
jgi:hypothetical protein